MFENDLKKEYLLNFNRIPTYRETIWSYVFTGGISKLIKQMVIHNITTNGCEQWTCVNVVERNKNIKEYVYDNIEEFNFLSKLGRYHIYQSTVISDLRILSRKFKILYLIGASWIHWGKYEHFRDLSLHGDHDYGTLEWNTTEFLMATHGRDPKWRDVVESQMRLIHMKYNYNLIDFIIIDDLKKSFKLNDMSSLLDSYISDEIVSYIARPCDKHFFLDEC